MSTISIVKGAERPDLIKEETLAVLFRESAQKFADKTALIFENQTLTYAELNHWSDAVAVQLANQGIKRGNNIGIWWKRGLELHVAILGIIKAGAAYVPIDRDMPAERVETVLFEVGADACFSMEPLNVECPILTIAARPALNEIFKLPEGPQPDDCAYVLYTSGSTGKPKGIPIGHRQICQLVRAEQTVLHIEPTDKVYQGFSVSFDMWCEETWVSYFAGATIWVADNTTSKAIDELGDVLRDQKITILHAVPSLLAVMEDNNPELRLINAGGEACTPQVLARWAKPNRKFFNSYGPTETTVSATFAALKFGDLITIGDPLPNYNLAVVDEQLNPLPRGERGELVISGPGLSKGYVKLPQLTQEKFIAKPAALVDLPGDRIYRTGDAAIINEDSTIDIQGRFDDQIKLRGFRIELGEIEVKLNGLAGVISAAVAVKKDSNDQDQLVGYVVTEDNTCIEESLLRSELAKVLPSYMVPGTIMALPEMPRMPSGKINRKALPVPDILTAQLADGLVETLDLNAPVRDRFLAILNKIFPNKTIDLSMDFFTDLGGHSLLAAALVSRLRRDAALPQASLKDIYLHRPLSKLVETWETEVKTEKKERTYHQASALKHFLCGVAQTISLGIIYGLFSVEIFAPYLGYYYVEQETGNIGYAVLMAIGLFCIIPPLFTALTIASKWLMLGKMKEGDYPLWGSYYFRWWFVKTMQRLVPVQFLNGTPLYPKFLRLLGVTVAADAQLSSLTIGAEDLVTIGSDVSISSQVVLNNAFVEDGMLKLRSIHIGDHAYIGSSAVISGGAVMEEWSELQDLSHLPAGKTIKPGEVWHGSPAQFKEKKDIADLPQPLPVSASTRRKYAFIFMLVVFAFPFIILLPLIPTIIAVNKLDNAAPDYDFTYLWLVPVFAAVYIVLFAAETILLTRILQHDIKPGKYPIYSLFYVRKWMADQLMSLCLIVLHPIFASVYVSTFFRLLGAKIGKNTEVSTASSVTHPLLEIGDEAFIADAVTLGEADVRGQQLILEKTIINSSSFVGNSALIPQGYELPGNMLVGVLSTPPSAQQLADETARDWFGSPAIAMPRRQESNPYPSELTTHPKKRRRLARGTVEFIRIILPESAIICFTVLFIAYAHDLVVDEPLWKIVVLFPVYYLCYMGIPAFLLTLILKWVFIGKYTARQKPMWTWLVWRSEAITSTYEALAVPFLLEFLKGTPLLPFFLRLMGVKIGKRAWLNTTDFTEHDMITLGDDVALNDDCGPQTHLFEDRVMKIGPVKIGSRSSIGVRSIILYDSDIASDCNIDALSLVMKGETLSPSTDWIGSPVKPA
ncbi:Pls/PosA family non-ribosomal peptide synthetase [Mucilaginibacter paludis]|uniref:Non-ribosomal peptide synthetase domain protein n=1 Tax=Mucilaginibacter paludis DSM 18603 TaxID=714943 RepID=H1Y1Z8_9SPHI|nr:Pls/PosA family non-ribosomal peptide synthetase [Mucilaginibacter paludis]EHQ25701.1 non-ribosomal peptide synthetase domain protein [Mucilaginibacter paludis DSM 18603]